MPYLRVGDTVATLTEGWTRREAMADWDNTADVTDGCCAISCNPDPGWIAVGSVCDGLPTTLITLLADTPAVTGTAVTGCSHITHQHSNIHTWLHFYLKNNFKIPRRTTLVSLLVSNYWSSSSTTIKCDPVILKISACISNYLPPCSFTQTCYCSLRPGCC